MIADPVKGNIVAVVAKDAVPNKLPVAATCPVVAE